MIELSKDLKKAVSKPKVLFKASEASWATSVKDNNYVTDGPFMFHCQGGDLIMLWSSFGKEGYTEAITRSDNGEITGNWVQESELLFKKDGGHGMLFNSLDGKLLLALHSPNKSLEEHPTFFEIIDENNKLHVKSELK